MYVYICIYIYTYSHAHIYVFFCSYPNRSRSRCGSKDWRVVIIIVYISTHISAYSHLCWWSPDQHAPSSRHLRALLSVCGRCSFGGLGRCSCRVCVGGAVLCRCVCVWPVDLFTWPAAAAAASCGPRTGRLSVISAWAPAAFGTGTPRRRQNESLRGGY